MAHSHRNSLTRLSRHSNLPHILWVERKTRKLSYRQAGKQIGISASYVHDIEKNAKDPSWTIVQKILRWMDNT